MQRDLRPHGVQATTEARAAKLLVGGLDLLYRLGVPPDHHVGVGTQAAQVVDTAGDDVVGRELAEQFLDLGASTLR